MTSNDKNLRDARMDLVLNTATDEAKRVLGDSDNKSVTTGVTMSVSATENGETVNDGVEASVSLKTSRSTSKG